jgi:hypothetical protein
MAEQPKPEAGKLVGLEFLVSAALVALAAGFAVYQTQKGNQVVRPVPDAQPAPAVAQLPGFTAELRRAKALCEGRARQAKSMAQGGRISVRESDRGRKLYTDAKADLDACIDFLRSGLATRFADQNPERAKVLILAVGETMRAFGTWADSHVDRDDIGGAVTWEPLPERLLRWLAAVREANNLAVEPIRAELDGCRLRDWDDLGR